MSLDYKWWSQPNQQPVHECLQRFLISSYEPHVFATFMHYLQEKLEIIIRYYRKTIITQTIFSTVFALKKGGVFVATLSSVL